LIFIVGFSKKTSSSRPDWLVLIAGVETLRKDMLG
jgi:hypothetical protein